jgi:hypothetical protein
MKKRKKRLSGPDFYNRIVQKFQNVQHFAKTCETMSLRRASPEASGFSLENLSVDRTFIYTGVGLMLTL